MWRDDALLLDMLIAARYVQQFNTGKTWAEFEQDLVLQSATQYQLQIIGEAASKVSAERRAQIQSIPWEKIIGFRNRLVHDYPRIELPKVWAVVEANIQPLIVILERIVPPPPEGEHD
jgi:uncharacterized protein with HEPN domain